MNRAATDIARLQHCKVCPVRSCEPFAILLCNENQAFELELLSLSMLNASTKVLNPVRVRAASARATLLTCVLGKNRSEALPTKKEKVNEVERERKRNR